ncbi:DUF6207 family protein [Streptomyces xiangluensis]|uniref:DUF6207 family protein n=1 Tax=Streptomyces xiangluensis TaxID=2665720 RepID=A0ABV8YVF9_9ACTN
MVDVEAADEDTALSFQQLLAERWATATAQRTTRDVDQPGVRAPSSALTNMRPVAAPAHLQRPLQRGPRR